MNITPSGLVIVQFTQNYDIYSTGTRAAFKEKIANDLVKSGTAVHTRKKGAPAEPDGGSKEYPSALELEDKTDEAPADDPLAALGDDWKNTNGQVLMGIARKITDAPISTKPDAIAAIELEFESRAGE